MRINTFFQLCIFICICLIAFNLVFNFVNGLGAFENIPIGTPVGSNTSETFGDASSGLMKGTPLKSAGGGSFSGFGDIWDIVLTLGGIGAVVVAILMHSAVPVGAYIFSGVFWVSYGNSISVISSMHIQPEFLMIGTVLMLFFWAGALAGMFSGSG